MTTKEIVNRCITKIGSHSFTLTSRTPVIGLSLQITVGFYWLIFRTYRKKVLCILLIYFFSFFSLLFSDETFHSVNSDLRELPPVELSTLCQILEVYLNVLLPVFLFFLNSSNVFFLYCPDDHLFSKLHPRVWLVVNKVLCFFFSWRPE